MDGIFSDVNNTESKDTTTNTIESNLSPSVLKKKIENLGILSLIAYLGRKLGTYLGTYISRYIYSS